MLATESIKIGNQYLNK